MNNDRNDIPARKRAKLRTTAPEWTERDLEWAGQAKSWMEQQVQDFYELNPTEYHTAADVLGYVDTRPEIPAPYARWLGDYETRYNWTSGILERFARARRLDIGSTVNARGREARCFRKHVKPTFHVEVEGPDAEVIRKAVLDWLAKHDTVGLDSLLITRGDVTNVERRAQPRVEVLGDAATSGSRRNLDER